MVDLRQSSLRGRDKLSEVREKMEEGIQRCELTLRVERNDCVDAIKERYQ